MVFPVDFFLILVPWLAPGPVYGGRAAVDRKQIGGC